MLIGDTPPKGHLDADEMAAFAENAMPQGARALHLAHIADCDRCRKILSNLIAINAEAEPEGAAAVVPFLPGVPWYRKFFVFPNLAYAMASLILFFGGLVALSLYQGLRNGGDTAVSQMDQGEAVRGPMAPTEPLASNTAGTANVSTNTAISTSNANAANAASAPAGASNLSLARAANVATAAPRSENEVASAAEASPSTTDAIVSGDAPKPPQPAVAAPPPPKDDGSAKEHDVARQVAEEDSERKRSASLSAKRKRENLALDGAELRNVPRTQAGGVAKVTPGPTRDMQQTFPNRSDNTFNLKSRRVGGKDFEFRNGAWYDTAYRNQATTNVRRGTEEYRKLDGGLRSIAENLGGVVVVVSGGKAYRIQ